jgi:mannosyltransferase OCH1-like enzyme
MTIFKSIRYRGVKIYANASKLALSLVLLLFPKWRKQIPGHLPAKRPSATPHRIPRILWQTNYTDRVTAQVYSCFLFNRFIAPAYEYYFCTDEQCDRFVEENYPGEIWNAFKRLRIGAARADFWRILVLLKYGGVYMDIDANFTADPDSFIDGRTEHVFLAMKNGEVTNYFLAGSPGLPILQEACDRIVANINEGALDSVYSMTGPIILDEIVKKRGAEYIFFKEAAVQGQFTNKKGQYADKPKGAWTLAQSLGPILSQDPPRE